jgi:aspartate/methionine/tyrosine aminotransferase
VSHLTGSPLTDLQDRYSITPHIVDLAEGYPRFASFTEQWQRFKRFAYIADEGVTSRDNVVAKLKNTVGSLLCIPTDVEIEVTFSGSIALERAIAALVPEDRETIVTVPGFDAINSFVERTSHRTPTYLELNPFLPRATIIDKLLEAIDGSVGAVVLVSPNNPSGVTLSPSELARVADACKTVDAILILDHCFLLIRPPECEAGTVFDLRNRCRWAGLWDSSKTVELVGEKFGLITSSADEAARIRAALSEIQLELPLGSLAVMDSALSEFRDGQGLLCLNELVRQNYLRLEETCRLIGLGINNPDAGSFALIELDKSDEISSDTMADNLFRKHAIAVIPSRVLYPEGWAPETEFLRISLARPSEFIDRLCDALINWRTHR